MYLKINPIINYNKNFIKRKQNNDINNNNITFTRGTTLKKPAFVNKNIQKISNKIISIYQQLPEYSAIKKPLQIPFEDGIAAFTVDKTQNEISKISLKIKENSKRINNWESISEFDKGMDMIINKKGQMTEGVYYEAGGHHLIFRRLANNLRRIIFKHNQYIPSKLEKYSWERIAGGEKIFSTSEKIYVDQDKPEVLFFEMAERSTSLLAEK